MFEKKFVVDDQKAVLFNLAKQHKNKQARETTNHVLKFFTPKNSLRIKYVYLRFNKFIKAINQGNKKKAEYFFNDLKEYLYIKEQCYEKPTLP